MNKKFKKIGIKNDNGFISVGSKVYFEVENQDMWGGDSFGILGFIDGEYVIKTKNNGIITIDKGYDAYFNTIQIVN